MIVHRTLPLNAGVGDTEPGGPLWFPRRFQGSGRHDNPDIYGCLYVAAEPVSAIAERLAPFRGSGALAPELLERAGRPLALVTIDVPDEPAPIIDLDEPRTLTRERLRPSTVATRERSTTQAYAAALYERHSPAGLRWWSTLESSWTNLTLFDNVAPRLTLSDMRVLDVDDRDVRAAADWLGLVG